MNLSKVVILEGPDGGGKSTLARWLHDRHSYQIVKTGPPARNENVFRSYTDTLLAAVQGGGRTVFDRHYLGERIYGPLLRNEDKLGDQGQALLERLIVARGVKQIICCPSWLRLVKGWLGKNDLLKETTQLRRVKDAYLAEAKRLNFIIYDWACGYDDLNLEEASSSFPSELTGYPLADTLWVGERAGKKRVVWDLPFHNTTGSARYLWEALQGVKGWHERRGAWTNAFDVNGQPRDLGNISLSLTCLQRIIALGDAAYEECCRQHISSESTPLVRVPHPQYWRRFHHHQQSKYQESLRIATTR